MTIRHLAWVQAHPITTFYLLAFAISWAGWVPSLGISVGFAFFRHSFWSILLVLPAVGPAVAAKLTINWQGGSKNTPLKALFRWRVSPGWYVLALGFPLLVVWAANVLSRWVSPTQILAPVHGMKLAAFLLLSIVVNPWEEVGWRGFALQRLQAHYSTFTATLLVGVLSGLWHIPIFFIHEGPVSMATIPFLPWFGGIIGWSFVMTWLFSHATRSLFICALCHVANNGFGALLGTNSYWTLALVKIGLAVVLWFVFGLGKAASGQSGNRNSCQNLTL